MIAPRTSSQVLVERAGRPQNVQDAPAPVIGKVVVVVPVCPAESVAVIVTVVFPVLEYEWVAVAPEPVVPSPKPQAKV